MAKRTEFSVNQADLQSPLFITNPLLGAKAAVPEEVILRDGKILWRVNVKLITHGMFAFSEGDSVEGAMWEFLDLRDQPDEAFVDFAKRYGPLALTSDGVPATRPLTPKDKPVVYGDDTDVEWLPPRVQHEGKWWYAEDVNYWRMYSVGLRAFIAFATAHKDTLTPSPVQVLKQFDLERYTDESFGFVPEFNPAPAVWSWLLSPWGMKKIMDNGPEFGKRYLAWKMNASWLRYAGLTPVMVWDSGMPTMTLTLGAGGVMPNNMIFSVLVAQLAALVTGNQLERVDQCSICGRMFLPTIKPGRHDRSFCPKHKIEGERERKRRWARKVAAERKAKQGV